MAILINNTYVADARAWKTAVSLGKAGYDVTVIARWGPGLATTERLDHHTIRTLAEAHSLLIFQVKAHLENFHSQQIDSRLL